MKSILAILILLFIVRCSKKEQIDENFTSKYWNLSITKNDSNLIEYENQALYFEKGIAYFYNKKIGNYSIIQDTLIIRDTSYYDKWMIVNGIRSSAKVDVNFYKFIKDDSLYKVTYTYLIGKILKANNDSLIIKKIEGYGIPFKYKEQYEFYNDTSQYDVNIDLDTIEFSSSLCYGNCPAIAIKIDKGLNYNYWGGEYADKQGCYSGKILESQFDQLEKMVRIANIEKNKSDYYPPVDAPYVELIIDYNNNKTKRFRGYLSDFPLRIANIGLKLSDLCKPSSINSYGCELNFEVELDIPEKRVSPPTPPPRLIE